MPENLFRGIFDTDMTNVISVSSFLFCIASALVIGVLLAASYSYRTRHTKSFTATLVLLPALVCVVIMMVNGNVGTGVAVAGAFSLVRFRSVPGSAKEIGAIFLAMSAGLILGMGYVAYAFLFSIILAAAGMACTLLEDRVQNRMALYKSLHITIPEDLDYTGVFDEVIKKYARRWELVQVKTTNMGSLFRLTYNLALLSAEKEKELIDELRCRNGNLEIVISRQETAAGEL